MVSNHPSIMFAKRSPVSSSEQTAGTKLGFNKSLKVLYDLGELYRWPLVLMLPTPHGLSKSQART